ncbi:Sugar phosphate isomerase/epimerase [Lachnospiraceae bacterium]|nr:Sugar phosphate isomerase/epimerase [Lachnospiraceae bacterium]
MITGIKTKSNLIAAVKEAGFRHLEIPYENLKEAEAQIQSVAHCDDLSIGCITVSAGKTDSFRDVISDALDNADRLKVPYILIETEGIKDVKDIIETLIGIMDRIKRSDCRIVLENGYYVEQGDVRVRRNGLCDAEDFRKVLAELRKAENIKNSNNSRFWAGLNIGHAMLFSANVVELITGLGSELKFLHANDNDGIHDMHQMPYTFTVGRGILLTDWRLVIRELHKVGFDGGLFLDIDGLTGSVPSPLAGTMLRMVYRIADEWDKSFHWDQILDAIGDKKLITFGAGPFMYKFMELYGERHTPYFIIDNDEKRWGEKIGGAEIKNPEEVRKIPGDEVYALVCLAAYRDYVRQFHELGIADVDVFDAGWFMEDDKKYAETWCPDKGDTGEGTLNKWYRYDKEGRLRLRRFQLRRLYHELRNIWRKVKSLLRRIVRRDKG